MSCKWTHENPTWMYDEFINRLALGEIGNSIKETLSKFLQKCFDCIDKSINRFQACLIYSESININLFRSICRSLCVIMCVTYTFI